MGEAVGSIPTPITMSNSDWYNQIETSVSDLTSRELNKALHKFDGVEKDVLSSLFIRKIEKNKNFRPLVFYVGYCLAKGKLLEINDLSDEEKMLIGKVTAAIEAENIATYYINHYLDNKGDIQDKKDEKNRVLAGIMSRDIAQALIEQINIDEKIKLRLVQLIKEIDADICSAQIYEVNTGTFNNMSLFSDETDFLKNYFDRCQNVSGQFYGRCAEMGYIIGSRSVEDTDEKRNLVTFYTEMITLLQYANDIGDYALPATHSGTVEKNFYKDYGSDFKNQHLTYPNYLLLKRATDPNDRQAIKDMLDEGFTDENMARFIKMMNKYEVFSDCFKLLNTRFNEEKKKLWLSPSPLRSLISSSVIIVRSNKLLTSIKKLMGE